MLLKKGIKCSRGKEWFNDSGRECCLYLRLCLDRDWELNRDGCARTTTTATTATATPTSTSISKLCHRRRRYG